MSSVSSRNKILIYAGALLALTLALYFRVIHFNFVDFDDELYINPHTKLGFTWDNFRWAFVSSYDANWLPVTWFTHFAGCAWFGMNAGGHHAINLVFHLANTLLLFIIFARETKAIGRSAFMAALFAVHPLHVESVAWVAERKDVVSCFFMLLSIGAYFDYASEKKSKAKYFLSLIFFALGLMSKAMVVTLPVALLFLDIWPLERMLVPPPGKKKPAKKTPFWTQLRPLLIEKIPFFALTIASCFVTFWAQQKAQTVNSFHIVPLWARLNNAVVSYGIYLWKTLWPAKLCVFYPYPAEPYSFAVFALAVVFILAATFRAIFKSSESRYFLMGWLWYLVTLLPVIGLVQVGEQAYADRYTYIPLIGIFILVSWSARDLFESWRLKPEVGAAAALIVIGVFSAMTWRQIEPWKNSKMLFEHALTVSPNNSIAHSSLGNALAKEGNYRDAVTHLEEAIRLEPRYARPHNNLANLYKSMGKLKEAYAHYDIALKIDPESAEAQNNMGSLLFDLAKYPEAIQAYEKALRLNPDYVQIYNNLGAAYMGMRNWQEAERLFKDAIRRKPDYASAYANLGDVYVWTQRKELAAKAYAAAVQFNPGDSETQMKLQKLLAD